jgi:hypothetical protein
VEDKKSQIKLPLGSIASNSKFVVAAGNAKKRKNDVEKGVQIGQGNFFFRASSV